MLSVATLPIGAPGPLLPWLKTDMEQVKLFKIISLMMTMMKMMTMMNMMMMNMMMAMMMMKASYTCSDGKFSFG